MKDENPKEKVKFLNGANFLKGGEFPRNFAPGRAILLGIWPRWVRNCRGVGEIHRTPVSLGLR
jgi:hypothetical protein